MSSSGQRLSGVEFFIVLPDGKIENYPQQLTYWIQCNDNESIINFLNKVETVLTIQEDLSKANDTLLCLLDLLSETKKFIGADPQLIRIFNGIRRTFKSLIFTYDNRLKLWACRNIMSILNQLKTPEKYDESSSKFLSFLGSFCLLGFNKQVYVTCGSFGLVLDYLCKSEYLVPAILALRDMFLYYNEIPIPLVVHKLIDKLKDILIVSSNGEYKDAYLAQISLKTISIIASWHMDGQAGAKRILRDENNMILKLLLRNFETKHAESIYCIYYLSKVPECRYKLMTIFNDDQNNCIKIIVKTLNETDEKQCTFSMMISILCHLCYESEHNEKMRELGIKCLMDVLRKEKNKKLRLKILRAFYMLANDEKNILVLIKEGILNIIVSYYRLMLAVEEHSKTNDSEFLKCQHSNSIEDHDVTHSKKLMKWLPAQYLVTLSESLLSSLTLHPKFLEPTEDKIQIPMENYSPVCSETDLDSDYEGPFIPISDHPKFSSISKKIYDYDPNREFKAYLSLLKAMIFSNYIAIELVDPVIIQTIIKYIKCSTDKMASNILQRIAAKMSYFLPLIRQGFIFESQILSEAKHYKDQLRLLAEESKLVGELQNTLIHKSRGSDIVAISIPVLINNKDTLRNLLLNHMCSGLQIIFDVLADPEHKWYEAAILSIFKLAKTLNLKFNPESEFKPESGGECHEDSSKSSSLVTVDLDDSAITGERLEVILLALEDKNITTWPVKTLLYVIVMAEKYSMDLISNRVKKAFIEKYHNSIIRTNDHKSFYLVWKWSWEWSRKGHRISGWCKKLNLFSVQTFMTMKIKKAERIETFKKIQAGCNKLVTVESNNPYIDFLKMINESMKDYRYWFTKSDLKVNGWCEATAKTKIEQLFKNIKIG
ncbi:uncharacterized protein LOC106650781 isoform X1 [Trichogramma pretiosum]|uniref:uncharacterized protein LOC106650781 isoform X1 n=1 Tax=Trichogramma pretiosum TaxID=7493 RepID=UPI0006C95ABD|nr:uncharacterized protein LOC106650781 isoform X1 [Trichogramma pretiosum]